MRHLRSFEIPVEILIFFIVNNQGFYTTGDVQSYLKQYFKIELTDIRTREILKTFYIAGKLRREMKATPRTKNVKVPHYTFNRFI